MTRLILIRHGVTEWNLQGRYCGHKDIGLSKKGKAQIKLLSNRLSAVSFDKIYCSNRKRATQTARILFKRSKLILYRGLCEIDFGALEGLRHKEIIEKYGDVYERWLKDPYKNKIPGAEPMDVFENRIKKILKKIIRLNFDKTVGVVCHGGVIGAFVSSISRNRNFWRCIPSAASITVIVHKKGKSRLEKFNDTTHLR